MQQSPKSKTRRNINNFNSQRSAHSKTQKAFTEVIFEDDYLIHHIKVKGQSMQATNNSQQPKAYSAEKTNENSIEEKRKKFLNNKDKKKTVSQWTYKTSSSVKPKINNEENNGPLRRSLTCDAISNINENIFQVKKNVAQVLKEKKRHRTLESFQTLIDPFPKICYKQQNLNQQVYYNFKGILDQFNKAKQKIEEKQKKNKPKVNQQKFRHAYKKPNFYQYQEFYRQNYQAKQIKQAMLLFEKRQYNSNFQVVNGQTKIDKEKFSINNEPSHRYTSHGNRKVSKVLINSDEKTRISLDLQKSKIKRAQGQTTSLLLKNKEIFKTQRKQKIKKTVLYLNKTHKQSSNCFNLSIDNQKIGPWRSHDQAEAGF